MSRALWIGVVVVLVLGAAFVGGWFQRPPAADTLHASQPGAAEATLPGVPDDVAPTPVPRETVEPTPLAAPDVAETPAHDAAAGTLRGRVLRAADRSPLAGWHLSPEPPRFASLLTRSDDDPEKGPEVMLDTDGRFELHDIDPDQDHLWLVGSALRSSQPLPVELPDDAFGRDLELVVDTGWIIEGRVRSSSGAALAQARITAFPSDETTEDDFLAVSEASFAFASLGWSAWMPLSSEDPRFTGELRDPSSDWVRADPSGHYRVLDRLAPRNGTQEVAVMAYAEGHGFDLTAVEFEGEASGVVHAPDLVLQPAGGLEGRVVGPDGFPHPMRWIEVLVRHDASGVTPIHHPHVVPVPYPRDEKLGLREPGQPVHDDWRDTASFEEAVELDIDYRTRWLEPGRYVLRVEKTPSPADSWPGYPTLDRGKAQRDAALANPAPSYAAPDLLLTEVEVRAGEMTRLDITLPWGGAVAGRVTDRAGAPVADAYVYAEQRVSWSTPEHEATDAYESLMSGSLRRHTDPDGGSRATLEINHGGDRTDDDGRFVIDRLPPGELVVCVRKPRAELGLAPTEQAVEVVPARTLSLDLVLEHVDPPAPRDEQR